MTTASLVGSAYVLVPLVLLVVIALIVTRRKRTATFLAVAAADGDLSCSGGSWRRVAR